MTLIAHMQRVIKFLTQRPAKTSNKSEVSIREPGIISGPPSNPIVNQSDQHKAVTPSTQSGLPKNTLPPGFSHGWQEKKTAISMMTLAELTLIMDFSNSVLAYSVIELERVSLAKT